MSYAGVLSPSAAKSPRLRVLTIPEGDAGAKATMRQMGTLARQALTDPAVIETAAAIVRGAPVGNALAQWQAIRGWMASHFKFLRDPSGVELLRTPRYLLDDATRHGVAQGDCDDAATLGAALGLAVGLAARFVAVAFPGKRDLSHVYAELKTPFGWRELDVTKPAQLPVGLRPSRSLVAAA